MKPSLLLLVLAVSLPVISLSSQEAPKPSPEIKKLSLFTGKWKLDEVDEASPFGPAGKATFDSEVRFIYNGFFVEERGTGKVGNQPVSYTILCHYDPGSHKYHSFYYDSNGTVMRFQGTLDGNTWKAEGAQDVNGKSYKIKSQANYSPDGKGFTYEYTYSEDGTTWKPVFKGQGTKVTSP